MEQESLELKEEISGLLDEQLMEMVTTRASDYRQEALDFAKAELTARGIDWNAVSTDEPEAAAPSTPELDSSGVICLNCGGPLRFATLVAEKEVTIIFSDNHEERFVKVSACRKCGQVSLLADFDTEVQP